MAETIAVLPAAVATQVGSQDSALASQAKRALDFNAAEGSGSVDATMLTRSVAARALQASAEYMSDEHLGGDENDGLRNGRRRRAAASASARAMRVAIAEAPPLPEPPAVVSFSGGVIGCPLCDRSFTTGFMWHLTSMHDGASLDAHAVCVLRALDRAVCCDTSCNGIRRIGMVTCNRCHRSTYLRPLVEGDIIPGPRTAAAGSSTSAAQVTTNASRSTRREDVDIPSDFVGRVRMLRGTTQTHIPVALRARHT